jgi:hypothetical protein
VYLFESEQAPVVGYCQHGNEPPVYIKGGELQT